MSNEQNVQSQIFLAGARCGAKLFRNNTGQGWVGKSVRLTGGSVMIENPRPLHAGLCKGSSDIIGFKSVQITPEMVGRRVAVFVAIEVKDGSRTTQEQINFLKVVQDSGGIAGVARSPEQAVNLLNQL